MFQCLIHFIPVNDIQFTGSFHLKAEGIAGAVPDEQCSWELHRSRSSSIFQHNCSIFSAPNCDWQAYFGHSDGHRVHFRNSGRWGRRNIHKRLPYHQITNEAVGSSSSSGSLDAFRCLTTVKCHFRNPTPPPPASLWNSPPICQNLFPKTSSVNCRFIQQPSSLFPSFILPKHCFSFSIFLLFIFFYPFLNIESILDERKSW